MLRGGDRAQTLCRLSVIRQGDQVSGGLFALFCCCFIVRNPTTWRETISAATFRLEDMRAWLAALNVDGAHAAFTLDEDMATTWRVLRVVYHVLLVLV